MVNTSIQVDPSISIETLYSVVQKSCFPEWIPPGILRLVFKGIFLRRGLRLLDYDLKSEDFVIAIHKRNPGILQHFLVPQTLDPLERVFVFVIVFFVLCLVTWSKVLML